MRAIKIGDAVIVTKIGLKTSGKIGTVTGLSKRHLNVEIPGVKYIMNYNRLSVKLIEDNKTKENKEEQRMYVECEKCKQPVEQNDYVSNGGLCNSCAGRKLGIKRPTVEAMPKKEYGGSINMGTNGYGKVEVLKGSKLIDTAMEAIKGFVVEDGRFALTPSGLAIEGKVFSPSEGALLAVEGTEFIKDIPMGLTVPTDAKDIEKGDIVFDTNNEDAPMYVLNVEKSGQSYEVTAVSPSDNRKVIMYPTKDLFGNQTFNKFLTPFNWDAGCNPVMNMGVMGAVSYFEGGIEETIQKLIPQAIKYSSTMNLGGMLKDKNLQTIAPLLVVGYKVIKDNNIDLSNISALKRRFDFDKKTLGLVALALALIIYLNKDRISEKLISEKVKTIPIIGAFAGPIAKILNSIPSFRKKAFKFTMPGTQDSVAVDTTSKEESPE